MSRGPARVGKAVSCRGCGVSIRFVLTRAGQQMPVESVPVRVQLLPATPGAALAVTVIDREGVVHRGIPDGLHGAQIEGYVPHWASCPAATRFQRSRV